ncbi:MAG: FIST N-terminal domain-containing protein [Lutimonas sp.]
MKAKSIYGNSPEQIKKALELAMDDHFKPTLAIAFISIKQDRHGICKTLKQEGIHVFGATSCGEFTESHQSEGESVIMLLDIDPEYFTILMEDLKGNDLAEIAKNLAKNALKKFKNPGFILCTNGMSVDNIILDGDLIIRSIEEVIGPNANITGGMAGDDWMLKSSYIFTHDFETNLGIGALVFDQEKVSLQGMAISGWKPIGITRTITKCEGTFLYTIDDKPALDMYLKYLGASYDDKQDQYHLFENVAQHYPFLVERETGAPMMATPMMVDKETKALICDVTLRQGSKLSFTMPPDFDFVEEILEKARELKDQSKTSAEAMLIFSCAGRVTVLGPLANLENQGLAEVWQSPMIGFYTYGEFGRALNERPEFHSTTNSWVVLKEK